MIHPPLSPAARALRDTLRAHPDVRAALRTLSSSAGVCGAAITGACLILNIPHTADATLELARQAQALHTTTPLPRGPVTPLPESLDAALTITAHITFPDPDLRAALQLGFLFGAAVAAGAPNTTGTLRACVNAVRFT